MLEQMFVENRVDCAVLKRKRVGNVPGEVDIAAGQINVYPAGLLRCATAKVEAQRPGRPF